MASDPDAAFAVGLDRVLYRTADAGETWAPVGGEPRGKRKSDEEEGQ